MKPAPRARAYPCAQQEPSLTQGLGRCLKYGTLRDRDSTPTMRLNVGRKPAEARTSAAVRSHVHLSASRRRICARLARSGAHGSPPASRDDRHLNRSRRSAGGHQRRLRPRPARPLHERRSQLLRFGTENPAATRQPVRAKSVTHVLGTICYPCVRVGHRRGLVELGGFEPPTSAVRLQRSPI